MWKKCQEKLKIRDLEMFLAQDRDSFPSGSSKLILSSVLLEIYVFS